MAKPNIIIDVAPLWEFEYTGISNVVHEIAKFALVEESDEFDIKFTAFDRVIDPSVISACVDARNGSTLRDSLETDKVKFITDDKSIEFSKDIGLYLHLKPLTKRYHFEAHVYYDFSILSVPETHHEDTIEFHQKGLPEQVATTDHFFTISESTSLDLQWYFDVPTDQITVAFPGHNADLQAADDVLIHIHGRPIEPYILVLGTVEPRKNISSVLDWLRHHPSVLAGFRIVFCGRHGWGPTFAELIEQYGLDEYFRNERIIHLGYISHSTKSALISLAEVSIYPSLFEGFGLPVLESMALNVPVIASCSTSIPEVLGPNGYYFDPHNTETLHDAFKQFVYDKRTGALPERLRALKKRSEEFSYEGMYKTIIEALKAQVIKETKQKKRPAKKLTRVGSRT